MTLSSSVSAASSLLMTLESSFKIIIGLQYRPLINNSFPTCGTGSSVYANSPKFTSVASNEHTGLLCYSWTLFIRGHYVWLRLPSVIITESAFTGYWYLFVLPKSGTIEYKISLSKLKPIKKINPKTKSTEFFVIS